MDSSICDVVIKGESSISDVSFFSGAKVIPEFIDSTPIVRAAINVEKICLFHKILLIIIYFKYCLLKVKKLNTCNNRTLLQSSTHDLQVL